MKLNWIELNAINTSAADYRRDLTGLHTQIASNQPTSDFIIQPPFSIAHIVNTLHSMKNTPSWFSLVLKPQSAFCPKEIKRLPHFQV